MKPNWKSTACPHDCPSTCALEAEILDAGHIGKVRGNPRNDYTAGVICAKVAAYRERVHNPNRLTHPLRRVGKKGEGEFEPISWDDALDAAAHEFRTRAAKYGPETVWPYHFAGTMGLVQRDSIHRFRHAFGYSRENETICVTTAATGWLAGAGRILGCDPREMSESDLIIVWGANPVSTQVNVMTHIAKARKERGAKLVVIDAYRTPTADVADEFICVRPGTDGALACGVMHTLFREGLADRGYMAEFTDCPERLERHLSARTPEWAEEISGVPADTIRELARAYGSTDRAFMRIGYGFTRGRTGTANMHAVSCLPAVAGKWRHKGGGALHTNRHLYGLDQTLVKGLDLLDENVRDLDMSRIGAVLDQNPEDLMGGPPVTAILTQNVNPAEVAPDTNLVLKGLARDDLFLCVHEQFMTATAKYADIVLPATMFLEHDDLYQGGGHIYLQVAPKLIEPPGECRSNVEVLNALALRLGSGYPAFRMTAMELIDNVLQASGKGAVEEILARGDGWIDCSTTFKEAHFLNGFGHPDGKFRFAPDWAAMGKWHDDMPGLPDHMEGVDVATPEKPYRLVAAPARRFLNTSFTASPSSIKKENRPTALIHPDTCEILGLETDDRVRLGNELGAIVVHVAEFDGLDPGTVIVEGIWPNHAFEEGVGVNALISAEPGRPAGGAVFHDTAVWMRAADAPARQAAD